MSYQPRVQPEDVLPHHYREPAPPPREDCERCRWRDRTRARARRNALRYAVAGFEMISALFLLPVGGLGIARAMHSDPVGWGVIGIVAAVVAGWMTARVLRETLE